MMVRYFAFLDSPAMVQVSSRSWRCRGSWNSVRTAATEIWWCEIPGELTKYGLWMLMVDISGVLRVKLNQAFQWATPYSVLHVAALDISGSTHVNTSFKSRWSTELLASATFSPVACHRRSMRSSWIPSSMSETLGWHPKLGSILGSWVSSMKYHWIFLANPWINNLNRPVVSAKRELGNLQMALSSRCLSAKSLSQPPSSRNPPELDDGKIYRQPPYVE